MNTNKQKKMPWEDVDASLGPPQMKMLSGSERMARMELAFEEIRKLALAVKDGEIGLDLEEVADWLHRICASALKYDV